MRVSTEEQSLDRQEASLRSLGAERLFAEKVSGKTSERSELRSLLAFVREGDTVLVESISRLARSTRDLLDLVATFEHRGVAFVSQKESINTSTPQGRFVLTVFAALAELEREALLQRQEEGIRAARARGVKFGRPKIERPVLWDSVIGRWRRREIRAVDAFRSLKMSKATFYSLVRQERSGWAEVNG